MVSRVPDDVVLIVHRYLSTRDAKNWGQTSKRMCKLTRACTWLWRALRITSPEASSLWNTAKRKRDDELPPVTVQAMLRVHGATLHTLQLGCFSMCTFLFGDAHLLFISDTAPNLRTLLLGFPFSALTSRAVTVATQRLTHLVKLALPLAIPPGHVIDHVPEPPRMEHLTQLQLHSTGFHTPRLHALGLALHALTSLHLVHITMLDSLEPLGACASLKELHVRYCTAMTTHPEHIHEKAQYNVFLHQLRKLALIECGSVVCVSTLVSDVALSSNPVRWASLDTLELNHEEFLAAESDNHAFLRCRQCPEKAIHLGFQAVRCSACRDRIRPALTTLIARL